jgi:glycosyltransferase involved in cell wall biosynthesis
MRVLAILYCYPPLLVPASICYLKLVIGLRRRGVDVEIVTISAGSFAAPGDSLRDPSLLGVVPGDVVEHRFDSPESSLGVRLLKRMDRKRRFVYPLLEPKKREWLWPARRALRRQDLRRFDVILSCSQPHANHLLGMELKQRTGLPWVAYFSDPWSDNPYTRYFTARVARHNRALEDRVLAAADRVLFTSEEMMRFVCARHPVLDAAKAGVLPHAFVSEWYGPRAERPYGPPVRLLHTGHFYGPRSPRPLLEALARLGGPALAGRLAITSVGSMAPADSACVRELGLQDVLQLQDTVPYLQSLALMGAADCLLLVDAKLGDAAESVFLPSKLVDYLGAGKPVVAITPAAGASARVVRAAGGVVCDIEDAGAIERAFAALVAGEVPARPEAAVVDDYEVGRVASRLVRVLESTAAGATMEPA